MGKFTLLLDRVDFRRPAAVEYRSRCNRCGYDLALPQPSVYRRNPHYGPVRCPGCGAQPDDWPDVLIALARLNLAARDREEEAGACCMICGAWNANTHAYDCPAFGQRVSYTLPVSAVSS